MYTTKMMTTTVTRIWETTWMTNCIHHHPIDITISITITTSTKKAWSPSHPHNQCKDCLGIKHIIQEYINILDPWCSLVGPLLQPCWKSNPRDSYSIFKCMLLSSHHLSRWETLWYDIVWSTCSHIDTFPHSRQTPFLISLLWYALIYIFAYVHVLPFPCSMLMIKKNF